VHLLRVPRYLPVERRAEVSPASLAVQAITIDFGNPLVRVDRPSLWGVVDATAVDLAARSIVHDHDAFLRIWAEERDRQFREDVPEFREVDIPQRAVRVLARLRGMAAPPADVRWDDDAARRLIDAGEVDAVVDAYSGAFVERMTPVADAAPTLERLAGRGFALGILSNWPLALTIDRFAEAHGWLPWLRAIVVSQRVGKIKPHVSIFRAAEEDLGIRVAGRGRILHVGDDWAADVVGARRAGWRVAWVRGRQDDTPLPTSEPGDDLDLDDPVTPDLEIHELEELDPLVELAEPLAPVAS
jgi:putative hydrolase of the HAD superfamily